MDPISALLVVGFASGAAYLLYKSFSTDRVSSSPSRIMMRLMDGADAAERRAVPSAEPAE